MTWDPEQSRTRGELAECECKHLAPMHDELGCSFLGCACLLDAAAVAEPRIEDKQLPNPLGWP